METKEGYELEERENGRVAEVAQGAEEEALADERAGLVDERAKLAQALRDLELARARVTRDAKRDQEEARSKLVAEILPVLDNFDRAIEAAECSGDSPAVVDGVRLVRRQLEGVLLGYGLVRFDAVGAPFDPAVHDATSLVPVARPEEDLRVVEQLQPGYMFGERLLRAAKVMVGKHVASAT